MVNMEPLLCPCHSHIEHSAFFLHIRIQNRLVMGRDAFIGIQDIDHPEFQSLGAVHGHKADALTLRIPVCRLFLKLFLVFLHMDKPVFIRLKAGCALLKLVQYLKEFLRLHPPGLGIFPDILIVLHCLPDIIDSCSRSHVP